MTLYLLLDNVVDVDADDNVIRVLFVLLKNNLLNKSVDECPMVSYFDCFKIIGQTVRNGAVVC